MHGRWGGGSRRPLPYLQPATPWGPASPPGPATPPRHATPGGCRAGVAPKGHPLPAESGFGGDPPAVPPHPGCAFQEGVPGGRMGNPQAGTGKGLTPDWGGSVPHPQKTPPSGGPQPPTPKMFTRFHHHNQGTPGLVSPGGWQHPKAPRVPLTGRGAAGWGAQPGARVRVSILLPPRDPPPRVPRALGPAWGGDTVDGPPRHTGQNSRSAGHCPTPAGDTPKPHPGAPRGCLSPPHPCSTSPHARGACPAAPPCPQGAGGPLQCPGEGDARRVGPYFPEGVRSTP